MKKYMSRSLAAHQKSSSVYGNTEEKPYFTPVAEGTVHNREAPFFSKATQGPDINQQAEEAIQLWPMPETSNRTTHTVPNFKCHSAVVYWLILEMNGGNNQKATEAIDKLHQDHGPAMSWISEALGYDDANPVNGPGDCAVGDILYMPNRALPMHSVVYLGNDMIVGFNNGGTWGKAGDQWTQESISAGNWKPITDGPYTGRMSLGVSPNNPVYKVSHAHAVAHLKKFAPFLALSRLT